MKKLSFSFTLIILMFGLNNCQQELAHIDEQFGHGIILEDDSSVLFFKGLTYYPEGDNIDTSKLKTKLKLYLYHPKKGESRLIKEFDIIKNWPQIWESYLDYNDEIIGFSLKNTEKERQQSQEGIYVYHRKTGKTNKIEETGTHFWISPDGKLVIYHIFDEETNSYHLYGYDTENGKRTLFEEAQPKIKNVEWLKRGEAALLMTEKEDSTILVEFKEQQVK